MAEQPQDDPAPRPVPESSGPAAPKPEPSKAEASKPEPTGPGPMAPDTTEPAIPEPLPDVGPLPDAPEHRWFRYLTHFFRRAVGPARGLTDPQLFHKISLAAFMAWVGLGADGLSSSAYGPEVAFLALGNATFLAIPLAILTALTVVIISSSYMRVIERFPSGGGGYVVATKLLGPAAGLISGSALVVDFVLTIAISLASCSDALFSLAPHAFHPLKLFFTLGLLGILLLLNLRGVRESVAVISPIFILFILAHVAALVAGFILNWGRIPSEFHHLQEQSSSIVQEMGWFPLLLLLFRAFTLGGGTYTGIEAVSEGVPMLREPKVETAKTTMRYMAASLAIIAGGILIGYLLYAVQPVPGKTLNAVLWSAIIGHVVPPGHPAGTILVGIIMVTAGALLFVAAQTGFLGGPRVLVFMALDRWVPTRFANLSERLVTSNGVFLMAFAAAATLLATNGNVHILVVLYSINVFLTFTLAQAGMCRDALNLRAEGRDWKRALFVSGLGFLVTAFLLVGTVGFKFREGGWATLLITGLTASVGLLIRRHYNRTATSLRRLDESLTTIPLPAGEGSKAPLVRNAQTAILTVTNFGGLGIHTLLNLFRVFPGQFKQVIYVSIGAIDSGKFKGIDEIEALRQSTQAELDKYVEFTRRLGIPADSRLAIGTDIVEELESLCLKINEEFPRSVTVGGQLVFQREAALLRWLHNQTCPALQRRLAFHGLPMVILPVRVY
jgi:amino acid transporter